MLFSRTGKIDGPDGLSFNFHGLRKMNCYSPGEYCGAVMVSGAKPADGTVDLIFFNEV